MDLKDKILKRLESYLDKNENISLMDIYQIAQINNICDCRDSTSEMMKMLSETMKITATKKEEIPDDTRRYE